MKTLFGLLFLMSMASMGQVNSGIFDNTEVTFQKSKLTGMERILGKARKEVGYAQIPFDEGGTVDIYYFTSGIKGTGFASLQLIRTDGTGVIPNREGTYEIVAFTKLDFVTDTASRLPFNAIERRLTGIFTDIANYASKAKIDAGETLEIPSDNAPTKYLLVDYYQPDGKEFLIGDQKHKLLLIIEVFKDECDYARANGSEEVLKLLKDHGFYPYSDLSREAVIK